ncbi:hypothetical protein E6C67_14155 [Azospirillum sp. TSA2s]|uniref:SPRY domain-containing protein n=1 Tax=Azospirillum sp. TSA2s TaxID=709810 RepID=UPI0010AAAFFF|nr:SPRY domain-containing protein [Azospirillum sp. TSA2s]QCG94972.1 hypothetical protein E6C67_14155 [Azospirillum sp. TSA2s]
MADTATTRGRTRKQTLASNVNIWGDPYLNTNFDLLDQQIDGVTTIALGTSTGTTLTSTNYATDQQRNKVWVFTGTSTQTCTATVPQVEQVKLVVNQASGPVVIAPAAGTPVTVAAGERAWIYNDGTNFGRGDPTLDKVRAPTASVSFNGQRITNLAAGTASSDAMRVGEAQTFVDTASAWANITGTTVTGTLYSAQAWAVGGSGVPPGGAAKLWAQQFGTDVDGTGYSAKEWAAGTRTTVDGTYKSARAYVSDATAQAGTASAWAGTASGWSSTASGWASTASGWSGTASGWAGTASGWSGTASGWAGTAAIWSTSTALVDGTYKGARGYAVDAAASAAGLNLPAITTANAGQVLTVKSDGSGYQVIPAKVCEGGTAGGTANVLTCTASPAATLARGVAISLQTGASANTGTATLNANSLGAVTIQKNGSALVAGDLPANTRVLLVYDGTYWQLSGGGGFTAATASDAATGTSTTLAVTPSALSGWTNALTELTPGNVDQANDFLPIWDTSASAMRKVRASALATIASMTTWNPSDKYSAMTLSNGNLTASINLSQGSVRATNSVAAGKYYWEILCINVGGAIVGIMSASGNIGSYPGNDAYGYAYEAYVGNKVNGNTEVAYGSVCVNGDVVGIAVDAINGKIWFRVNGVWQGGGDPTAGTNAAYTGIAGSFFPAFGSGSGGASPSVTARFSPGSWSSPAPTGFTYIA